MTNSQLINQTSGIVEYYTPSEIVEAARKLMDGIELDPFSSPMANLTVKAKRYFTEADDGFKMSWKARTVWVNHPFGRDTNARAILKIRQEVNAGRAGQLCCITYACTSEAWFRPLLEQPQCYLSPRTNYYLPDGTVKRGVTKGSVVSYFGHDVARFRRWFSPLGVVKV